MSMWRFTEQAGDPPAPSPEGSLVTGRFYTKLVSGVLRPFMRDSNGNVSDFIGPQGDQGDDGPPGPPGPPGSLAIIPVLDLSDPTEIEAIGLADYGSIIYAREVIGAGLGDELTAYAYDLSGPAVNAPFVMDTADGGTTRWIANTSKFTNSGVFAANGSRLIGSAEVTKLAGVEAGATNDAASAVAPPDVSDGAGSAGTDTATYANANHVHSHGNRAGGTLHAAATTAANGFMSAADKLKLDSLVSGNPSVGMQISDDFISGNEDTDEIGSLGWRNSGAGTGNSFSRLTAEASRPGIMRMIAGTVDTARQAMHLGDTGFQNIILGGGIITWESLVRMTGALNTHEMSVMGLGDIFAAVGDQTNGVYFQVLGADTNWHLVTAAAGVRTRRDTGIAYSTGSWIKLGFEVNAGATSIQAKINGADVGAPITTNIPVLGISPVYKTDGIGAGSSLPVDIDYFLLRQIFTTAR